MTPAYLTQAESDTPCPVCDGAAIIQRVGVGGNSPAFKRCSRCGLHLDYWAKIERLQTIVTGLLEIRTYVAQQLRYGDLPQYIVWALDSTREATEAKDQTDG